MKYITPILQGTVATLTVTPSFQVIYSRWHHTITLHDSYLYVLRLRVGGLLISLSTLRSVSICSRSLFRRASSNGPPERRRH